VRQFEKKNALIRGNGLAGKDPPGLKLPNAKPIKLESLFSPVIR
jgi:hypothetical protein